LIRIDLGMRNAPGVGMAHKIDEFPVFLDAQEFVSAVTAILQKSSLRKNSKAYEQISEANDSILANMDEGFDQESHDGFSKFLYYSKGSLAEVMRRLRRAAWRGQVPREAVAALEPKADSIGRQLGGLVKYLKTSGFKDRGRFKASQLRRSRIND
jgi:four helix bundle protein